MNERIKELAVQIGFPMGYDNPAWAYEQDIYKFAELIVRECSDILVKEATSNHDEGTESYNALIRESNWMKRYFGVKE